MPYPCFLSCQLELTSSWAMLWWQGLIMCTDGPLSFSIPSTQFNVFFPIALRSSFMGSKSKRKTGNSMSWHTTRLFFCSSNLYSPSYILFIVLYFPLTQAIVLDCL
jgi:hypothetical protein